MLKIDRDDIERTAPLDAQLLQFSGGSLVSLKQGGGDGLTAVRVSSLRPLGLTLLAKEMKPNSMDLFSYPEFSYFIDHPKNCTESPQPGEARSRSRPRKPAITTRRP